MHSKHRKEMQKNLTNTQYMYCTHMECYVCYNNV